MVLPTRPAISAPVKPPAGFRNLKSVSPSDSFVQQVIRADGGGTLLDIVVPVDRFIWFRIVDVQVCWRTPGTNPIYPGMQVYEGINTPRGLNTRQRLSRLLTNIPFGTFETLVDEAYVSLTTAPNDLNWDNAVIMPAAVLMDRVQAGPDTIYKKVSLPADRYYFGECCIHIMDQPNANLTVASLTDSQAVITLEGQTRDNY